MSNFTEENDDTEQFRIPGQKTSIRFFNHDNEEDIRRLLKIVQDKKVREWVEGIEDMDFDDVKEWAGQKGQNIGDDCLFAIVGSREYVANNEIGEVQGFVNTYEMPEELRIRMEKEGFLAPDNLVLEVSYARNPEAKGRQVASGLLQVCFQVNNMIGNGDESRPTRQIFSFVDRKNFASIKVMEEAGFVLVGEILYEVENEDKDLVFKIDWEKAQSILRKEEYGIR